MKEIHVTVREGTALQTDHTAYTTGDGECWVVFDLGEEWKDLPTKIARFQTESGYQDIMFRGDRCHVPVFDYARKLEVGLYGGNLRTTTPARIIVRPGIRSTWGAPPDPEPSVFDQLMDRFDESDLDMENTEDGIRLTLRYRGGEKTAVLRHSEVYVGSGNMPEGYRVQLDPQGGTAILRVRDLNGNIIPIPSIRGEKGDRGETGRPGRDAATTVNGQKPDALGNITLTAQNVEALPLTGGSLTGELAMGGYRVSGLGAPRQAEDAASKGYVDGRRKYFRTVLTAEGGWQGEGPYSQTLLLSGIRETDTPHVCPILDGDAQTAKGQLEAWQCVSCGKAEENKIVFTCLETQPEVDIPVQVEVIS